MNQPSWRPLDLVTHAIPAKPEALWTLVHGHVNGPCKLKIEATGKWKYTNDQECGPNGRREAGFADDRLNASASLGALIGKIGGSPADKPGTTTFAFAAGSYVVLVHEDKVEGALYLTMNDDAKLFEGHSGQVDVTIEEARSGSGSGSG